ncbi:Methionyl-tRNA synthetase [Fulvivirga imtechensis AK7]|uniref:Methionine--tRNA ligase n=1 Tax=Fulvivirga imtechensis AK7 TaxID=1237149 RepID=L8JTQ7_9BACT|nr:methionine--tRNA ligase [Fulvivirga imtechensis]ELR72371.1 Methionyl-tRNA synthetase [Fulvivirga imtechensis AK7]
MSDKKFNRYTITAALPYANGPVHIGHLAGVYVPADIYARYLRSQKRDVLFVCGSDEHGVAITLRAKKEGVTPKEIVDKYHQLIKRSFEDFGISFDIYSRTSAQVHHETSSEMFKKLYEDGVFEQKTSEQYYDEQSKQFLADRYIIGTCPNCKYDQAYGDQCEKCGTSLSPSELINPRSVLSGDPPVLKETTHWYFPMNKYEEWLRSWILEGHKEWKSNVYGQCKSWLDNGLMPRAMTRDLDWGVRVPVEGADGKVLYVWFDAPIGYISATKEWAEKSGKSWEPYWKEDDTRLIHFIGKDNIVFHCIIFPSILHAEGSYILPDNVPANEFLNLEGNKISTSKNWAVWLHEYLAELPGKEDVLRYVLCANAPETKDNDFTWKDFQTRNNSELVAIFGNFINRSVVLTNKYYEGKLPARGQLFDIDEETIKKLNEAPKKIADSLELFRFREALAEFIDLARTGNKYLADTEPWKLIKTNPERVKTIMNIALQIAANLSIVGAPFLPHSSHKLSKMLNISGKLWADAGSATLLEPGHQVNEAELLFEKVEDETIEQQVQKLENTKKVNEQENAAVSPSKNEITFDDFIKMDIRVGTILEAEKMPKSKKLLKLKVDTGIDQRTVLSGIAEHYSPEQVVGQQVSILVNLAPRKIMGIESQGMILMAENVDGTLRFIQPSEKVKAGSGIS